MKVGFQVEGPTDLRVLHFLVETILGRSVERCEYWKRQGGIHEVFRTLDACVRNAGIEGCCALVVGVDANGTTPHDTHPAAGATDCRYCQILGRLAPLFPPRGRSGPAFLVFVPVQALEAWILQYGQYGERQPLPQPQALDRRVAKTYLWGTPNPGRKRVDRVLERVLAGIGPQDLDVLAEAQPSFRTFREAVQQWARTDAVVPPGPGASAGP